MSDSSPFPRTSLRARLMLRMLRLLRDRFATATIEQTRAMARSLSFPLPRGTRIVPARDLPAEWVTVGTPGGKKVILYLHGGGYVVSAPRGYYGLLARIAARAGVRALHVEYRLAPEHPFPAALDDTLRAYDWLLLQGLPASDIVIAGDSAGGGLALAAMSSLRARGRALPAGAVFISPWCDLTMTSESATSGCDVIYTRESYCHYAQLYAASTPLDDPRLSPIHADMTGLPPMLIHAGERDLLRDDAVQLAERVRAAGGQCRLHVYQGLWHDFHLYPPLLVPETGTAVAEIAAFVQNLE